jgi:hypothetical protein
LRGFVRIKTLIIKDCINEILKIKTISIWIIHKKMFVIFVNVVFA